jgi:hypothetical protein
LYFFSAGDIIRLLESFEVPPYTCLFKGDSSERRNIFHNCHIKNQEKLHNQWGFELEIKPSTISEGNILRGIDNKTVGSIVNGI